MHSFHKNIQRFRCRLFTDSLREYLHVLQATVGYRLCSFDYFLAADKERNLSSSAKIDFLSFSSQPLARYYWSLVFPSELYESRFITERSIKKISH